VERGTCSIAESIMTDTVI